jgi:hypothetical protein
MTRIDEANLKAAFLEYLVERDPIHAGRFHRYRRDSTCSQPVSQPDELSRYGSERLHALVRSVFRDSDIVRVRSDVDACSSFVYDAQLFTGSLS